MSTIKVNKITNVSGSGEVEVQLPLKMSDVTAPSAPSDGHGILYVDSSDDKLKYKHTGVAPAGGSSTLEKYVTPMFPKHPVYDNHVDEVQECKKVAKDLQEFYNCVNKP